MALASAVATPTVAARSSAPSLLAGAPSATDLAAPLLRLRVSPRPSSPYPRHASTPDPAPMPAVRVCWADWAAEEDRTEAEAAAAVAGLPRGPRRFGDRLAEAVADASISTIALPLFPFLCGCGRRSTMHHLPHRRRLLAARPAAVMLGPELALGGWPEGRIRDGQRLRGDLPHRRWAMGLWRGCRRCHRCPLC